MMEVPSRVMEDILSQSPAPQDDLTPVVFHESNHEWIGFHIVKKLEEAIQRNTIYNILPSNGRGEAQISPSCIGPWEVVKWCYPSGRGGIWVTLMRGSGKMTIASVSTDRVHLTVRMYHSNNSHIHERVIALKCSKIDRVIEELVNFIETYRVFPS